MVFKSQTALSRESRICDISWCDLDHHLSWTEEWLAQSQLVLLQLVQIPNMARNTRLSKAKSQSIVYLGK